MGAPGRDPARPPRPAARRPAARRPAARRPPPPPVVVDTLTGTLPRDAIERAILRIASATGPARRHTAPSACVLFDVVGLKAANAARGFSAGDALLRRAADAVRSVCPDAAMIGRLGGDELLALFTGHHAAQRAAGAADDAARATDPRLRAAWSEVRRGEDAAALFDRLYAACRGDVRGQQEGG